MIDKNIIYAAGYYPLMHDKKDWRRDLQLMKEAGITLVRTAELFNTWDRIEPEKGQFNFEFLDEFFDLCEEYDLKILLGSGTASPPYWVHELYPEVNIMNNHGERYPNNVSYSWACVDHPKYIDEVERYIKILVKRYKDHKALYAYQIHNEISLPFMPLKDGDVDLYCYCDHSQNKFRKWVENKYKTLENLNYAYRWGATNTCHTKWSQVEAPKTKPTSWSSVTRWLDWRLYWMENLVNFVKFQNSIIKSLDQNHQTTTNIFFLKSQDPMGVITALDQFEMAKTVDVIGYDLYPGSGDKLETKAEFSSMFLDMSRSTAEVIGKDYWLLETESGPINGWVLGPSRNVKGFDLKRNIFEAIGHDSKATLYQGWREWDFQPLHWGAIVDLDGHPTERTSAASDIGKRIKQLGEALRLSKTQKSKIAILLSKENAIILNGMGQEDFLVKALRGAYRVFWEMNFKVDFITPEIMNDNDLSQYDLIYMPFMAHIEEKLVGNIASYVEAGGCIIGTARCGMLGQHGWYNHQIPCFDLGNVFGVEVDQTIAKVNANITYEMRSYKGHWHKEILKIQDQTEVIARFNDENPAVTRNVYGKGQAFYFATHPEVAYLEDQSLLLPDLLKKMLKDNDIKPLIELDYTNRKVKEIDAHYLENENHSYIIITNYVDRNHLNFFNDKNKDLRITINHSLKFSKAIDVSNQDEIDIRHESLQQKLDVCVTQNEVLILKLVQ